MFQRQFPVLYREFLFRMVDLEIIANRGDLTKLLGQFGAFLGAISFMVGASAVRLLYVEGTPSDIFAQAWPMVHFLIATTMLMTGLFAVLSWDSAFPDARDVMVLAPLPVHFRTIFLAKIAALGTSLALVVAAVSAFAGVTYPLILGYIQDGWLAPWRMLAAYWVTMAAAGLFALCGVLGLHGLLAQFLSRRLYLKVSAVLQLALFCGLLSVYFLQPPLAGPTAMADAGNHRLLEWLPSYWFLALFLKLSGELPSSAAWLASRAGAGLGLAFATAATSMLLAYFRTLRRIVEEPDLVPNATQGWQWPRWGGTLKHAMLLFSARTILRSRQHRVILALYLGIGLAISLAGARAMLYRRAAHPWNHLDGPLLMASVIMLCFSVLGARVVFAMPIALRANWIFRVTRVRGTLRYLDAAHSTIATVAVIPVWCGSAVLFLAAWPWDYALQHLLVLAMLGVIFADVCAKGFEKIPFTCSYLPGKANIHVSAAAFAIALIAITDIFVDVERRTLRGDGSGYLKLLLFLAALAIWARRRRMKAAAELPDLRFDEVPAKDIHALELYRDGRSVAS
ncbi:MAG: hypothetical protein NTZ56_18465 [Acidobacteria bacterium]|nr:hypothetical protein [Acidobacteriota bacterium]